jgi:hypothetical protein
MDQPAAANPATAREIIAEILRNMREGLEPLHYTTLPPSVYHVYLHADDLDRLRGIASRLVDEAQRALDAELASMNRASLAERLRLSHRVEPKVVAPEGGWQISLLENTDDGVEPGDIVIQSELALPAKDDLASGSMTRRIATRRSAAGAGSTQRSTAVEPAPPAPAPSTPAPAALAVIEYDDTSGHHTFSMTKEEIVVGRGGRDYWTDLKLEAPPDVSREHFRLRRDGATGQFFLKDLSRLGTTINGTAAPSSIDFSDGEKRDRNVEAPVPAEARIGLANVLYLEFRSVAHG